MTILSSDVVGLSSNLLFIGGSILLAEAFRGFR